MQNILDKIHTQASIILCENVEETKQSLIKEINEVSGASLKVFEKINDTETLNFSINDARTMADYVKTTSTDRRYLLVNKKFSIARVDSQNAILKVLEEINQNTFFILLTESITTMLPTILSRCVTIKLKTEYSKSAIKNTLIKNKDFHSLSRLLSLENAAERGSISEKYIADFAKVVL